MEPYTRKYGVELVYEGDYDLKVNQIILDDKVNDIFEGIFSGGSGRDDFSDFEVAKRREGDGLPSFGGGTFDKGVWVWDVCDFGGLERASFNQSGKIRNLRHSFQNGKRQKDRHGEHGLQQLSALYRGAFGRCRTERG